MVAFCSDSYSDSSSSSSVFQPIVTGSLAFDNLMHVEGSLARQLRGEVGEVFSAAFLAPRLTRAFGGCAGNVAYALHRLGDAPRMVATVGSDFSVYEDYLRRLGIWTGGLLRLEDCLTAQAFVATDAEENQFIAFHPGATGEAHRQELGAFLDNAPLAIVSPNGKAGMIRYCHELAAAGVPFLFDPGQALGMFDGEELRACLELAPMAIFNVGEMEAALRVTGLSREALAVLLEVLVVTRGEGGSEAWKEGAEGGAVGCVRLGETRDPTGCGDAYRAGLMFGMMRGWGLLSCMRFGAVVAGFKAVWGGGQGYELSLAAAGEVYAREFGEEVPGVGGDG